MARETKSGKFVMMASRWHWDTRSSLGGNDELGQPRGFVSKCHVATSFLIQDKNRISNLTNSGGRLALG